MIAGEDTFAMIRELSFCARVELVSVPLAVLLTSGPQLGISFTGRPHLRPHNNNVKITISKGINNKTTDLGVVVHFWNLE